MAKTNTTSLEFDVQEEIKELEETFPKEELREEFVATQPKRKSLTENEITRRELDKYAYYVLGLLGNQDAQPFLDYCNSNAIGGMVGVGEVLFGIIRRQLQDRDYSGAMDSGWDSGLKFVVRDVLCEQCHLPIPNARLGQKYGCNAAGALAEGKKLNGKLEDLCPLLKTKNTLSVVDTI